MQKFSSFRVFAHPKRRHCPVAMGEDSDENDAIAKDATCHGREISLILKWITSAKNSKSPHVSHRCPSNCIRHNNFILPHKPSNFITFYNIRRNFRIADVNFLSACVGVWGWILVGCKDLMCSTHRVITVIEEQRLVVLGIVQHFLPRWDNCTMHIHITYEREEGWDNFLFV